ncbi:BEM_HP_G0153470.mRNA.1.CDS.1 [Saccharomyces cerevisiae]|nr:BEM_HP_G0153470.mRNA.1.CDS.1 [Saccharomyces cerevisiae]CAI6698515.1 BEM_HP_G0153470.mRNA.1.CDS.1 [Saccharomyces cerevisiae]
MSTFETLIKRGGNEAIKINPPTGADFHITSRGSDWFWTCFCCYLLFGLILTFLMFRKPVNDRFFYLTGIAPNFFMCIAYFTMASNLGWIPVKAKYNHVQTSTQKEHPGYRQIFYSRFVGWFLALPWPIIQICMLAGTPFWQMAFNVCITEFFTVCWLIAACVHSTYKWGYYTIGLGAAIVVSISVMTTSYNLVKQRDNDIRLTFLVFFSIIMFLWIIVYPTCFGITDGGNVLQPDSAGIFYGIIDLILMCFIPTLLVPIANHFGADKLGYHFGPSDAEAVMAPKAPVASPRPAATPNLSKDKKKKSEKSKKSKKSKKSEE